tara:strand:- start:236 stop:418 length:183 start_codon:yes stop_codon:yes gene_type:complete
MTADWLEFVEQLRATEFMKNRLKDQKDMYREDFALLTHIIGSAVDAFACGDDISFTTGQP